MITGSQEYLEYLSSYNPPNILARIPANEPVYTIDLNTRAVTAPTYLGVEGDHNAEYLFYMMDRYLDSFDLAQCVGIVTFRNAKNEEYVQVIPAYDVQSVPGKIIFAWDIQGPITKYAGVVQFAFKFFKMDVASGELLYELNTLVTKAKVLVGWSSKNGTKHNYISYPIEHIISENDIMNKIQAIYNANNKLSIFWIDTN